MKHWKSLLVILAGQLTALIILLAVVSVPLTKSMAQSQQVGLPFYFLTNLAQQIDFSDGNTSTGCQTNRVNSLKCYIDLTSGAGAGTYILAYASGGDVLFCGRCWNAEVETAGTGGTNWNITIVSDGVTTTVLTATTTFTQGAQFNWGTNSLAAMNGMIRIVSGGSIKYTTTGTFSAGKVKFTGYASSLSGGRLQ